MPKYPDIKDDNFYKQINTIYKDYKIPQKKKEFEEICFPKSYELQLPQKFVSEFISPKTPYKGVLVYHRIGAGKTCTAIRVSEVFKKYRKIIVVLPASLKGNFRSELRSECAGESYITKAERQKLKLLHPSSKEYKEIIEISDKRIDKNYKIFSYNKFIEGVKNNEIKLKNTLLIIDEIQNMVSEDGTYYQELKNLIDSAPDDLRTILLSATPMFDKPHEIGLTINLLRPEKPFPVGAAFNDMFIGIKKNKDGVIEYEMKNKDLFKETIKGHISFFRGAPPYVFPSMKLKYVECPMSEFQYKAYQDVLKNDNQMVSKKINREKKINFDVDLLPNNFFIGTRYVSNIVFPNKKVGDEGLESFTRMKIISHLDKFSTKFNIIMKKIESSTGKIFFYSGFKEFAGIRSFISVLEVFGYQNYAKAGEGPKRFAIWSGDENTTYKEEIKSVFNLKDNLNGSKLKLILGSSSIKEGVSFAGVRQVHILEPYWNIPRLEQVIGRASRFCSHKDLEKEKRDVKVYVYLATAPRGKLQTVDSYIYELSKNKNKLVSEFELCVKQAAIDCELNKNSNQDENTKFKCDV
jgi:superfamily II DNA or RNA helicase